MAQFFGKMLLLDNDNGFIDAAFKDTQTLEDYPCLFHRTLRDASQVVKSSQGPIRVVFISTSISPSKGMREVAELRTIKPTLPIFLITHQGETNINELMDEKNGVNGLINRPKTYLDLINAIRDTVLKGEQWSGVQASAEEKFEEVTLEDKDYISCPLTEFVITRKSLFNIFIRLGPGRFIKILNAGDPIEAEFLDGYKKKNVTQLFIKVDEHRKYIAFCTELSESIIRKADVSNDIKINNILHIGANISRSISHLGIAQDKLDAASGFLGQSISMVKSLRATNQMKTLLSSIENKDHCASVSFLASLIANEVGFESIKMLKLVGISALIHDIGLYDLIPGVEHEYEIMKLDEHAEKFARHSARGAELVRASGLFDETVAVAIEQHHLRRRGNDTTRRTININLLGEVIGAADEMHNFLLQGDQSPQKLRDFIQNHVCDFSPQIEKALLKLLKS